jgi:membrane protein DedA with SNARE-associated domain
MLNLVDSLVNIFSHLGYLGIIALMAIESSFIPFPSEVVIPPAAFLAFKGELNIWLVILSGISGSLIGAAINYFLAMFLGRAIIYRLADHKISKVLLVDSKKIQKAENYFLKYGKMSTLIGRLVPVVRQFISLPAGFFKMNFGAFLLFTAIGSAIWTSILASLGYFFGANKELLSSFYHEITYAGLVLGMVFIIFIFLRKKKKSWFFWK